MNKTKAAREGTLPDYLSVEKQLVLDSLQHLFTRISAQTMNQLVEMIGYEGGLDATQQEQHSNEPETTTQPTTTITIQHSSEQEPTTHQQQQTESTSQQQQV